MRDHRKLTVFQKARELALSVYTLTYDFPPDERFGLTSQMRRCAVSVGSNIVEGSARQSQGDYLRFLDIAFGSVRELGFQAELAHELGFLSDSGAAQLKSLVDDTSRLLHGLMKGIRRSGVDT